MLGDVSTTALIWLAGAILLAGILTGLLAGLFGIGGGAVIVPVLYEMFGMLGVAEAVRMQLCIGTSLAIIVPTSVRSWRAHRAKGLVLDHVIRQWTLPALVGVAVGAFAAALAPAVVFKIAFVVIAAFIAARLLLGRADWRLATDLPGAPAMAGYGFTIGLCSSLMGVGGGSISTAILTVHGKPIHNAVATSAGLGVPLTIAGTIGYAIAGLPHQAMMPALSVGFVSLIGFAVMAPVSTLVAPWGARLAHRLGKRHLEIAFGTFLLLVSARFLASLAW